MTAEAGLYRDWKGWRTGEFGALPVETERYYAMELDLAGVPSGPDVDVLEVGFGNGGFATHTRARGWRYTGTEIDGELVARAREAGYEVHEAASDLIGIADGRMFDLVCAFDVLEHLEADAIIDLLEQVRALLKPGGRFVARFPSGDSPFSLGMQNGDMTHRTHIGSGMVRQFCLASGLVPLQIRPPAFPVRGLGVKRGLRRALVLAGRAPVRTFFRLVFHDNQPRVIDPNMVIVLARSG